MSEKDKRWKEETCHHRSFTIYSDCIEDGAEQYLVAKCDKCGMVKAALVDWTRDWAQVGPAHVDRLKDERNERNHTLGVIEDGPEPRSGDPFYDE